MSFLTGPYFPFPTPARCCYLSDICIWQLIRYDMNNPTNVMIAYLVWNTVDVRSSPAKNLNSYYYTQLHPEKTVSTLLCELYIHIPPMPSMMRHIANTQYFSKLLPCIRRRLLKYIIVMNKFMVIVVLCELLHLHLLCIQVYASIWISRHVTHCRPICWEEHYIYLHISSCHHWYSAGILKPSIVENKDHLGWPIHYHGGATMTTQISKFMRPTWGPPGSCQPQMGPTLSPWPLLSG